MWHLNNSSTSVLLPIYTKRCFGVLLSTDANLNLVHQLTTGFILKAPWVQTRVFRPELLAEEGTSTAPLLVLAMSSTTLRTTSTRMGQEGGMSHCRELQVLSFGFRMSYPALLEDCKACHLSFKVTLPNHIWNKWCVFCVHTNPYLRKCAHCNFDCMYVIIWLLFIQEKIVLCIHFLLYSVPRGCGGRFVLQIAKCDRSVGKVKLNSFEPLKITGFIKHTAFIQYFCQDWPGGWKLIFFTAHRIVAVRHRVQVKSARLQRLGSRGLDGDSAHQLKVDSCWPGISERNRWGSKYGNLQSQLTFFTQAQFSTPRFEGNINIIAFMNTHVIKCQYGMFTFLFTYIGVICILDV